MPPQDSDLQLALELADVADELTLARFRASDLVVETKPDLTPVSEADRAVERALRALIGDRRPSDRVLGEEYGDGAGGFGGGCGDGGAAGPSEGGGFGEGGVAGCSEGGGASGGRLWILDPIDGTKSYVRGVPHWATLIALQQDGDLRAAVVSAPAVGRRWWAARDAGAFTVDRPGGEPRSLHVSAVRELGDAQLCFGGLEEWRQAGRLQALIDLAARCWRTRGYGDFWNYMLVAEGAVEIGCDPQVSLWDLAAPMLIVEEAGGRFTDLAGEETAAGGSALASNGRLHEAVLSALAG